MDAESADTEPCDCAPTPAERRALWAPVTRRGLFTVGAVGAVGLGAVAAVAGPLVPRANAAYDPSDYPSWEDVERAKSSQSAKAAEVSKLESLISQLKQRVADTQAAAEKAADEFYEAQQAFFEADYRADELQKQADEQAEVAGQSAAAAGRVAAQLYRNGGDDTSLELFFSGSAASADDLLTRLGQMDKMLDRNDAVYADAVAARDSAQKLTDQAQVARDERDRLQKVAEQKMAEAKAAAEAAQAALTEQNENLDRMEAQLAALKDETAKTVADYKDGVEAARKEKERLERIERKRRERERREREERERERRERENNDDGGGGGGSGGGGGGSGGGGGGGGSGGGGGGGGGSGWVRPSSGAWTSGYGWRTSQCGPQGCASSFHAGVDLSAGCGAGIYAAHSGTVTMAYQYAGYGNYIRIEHGGGIGTGYGHLSYILVGVGQQVSAGQLIAYEGNTGRSFGCHLHFEVYQGGGTTNPSPFMAARGVTL